MKVKCINFYNLATKSFENSSSSLTLHNEYLVLEIIIEPNKNVLYRLVGDGRSGSPALFDAKSFEISSDSLPSNWSVCQDQDTLHFSPKSWQQPGFWENCYEGDPEALEIYKREARIIYEEEGVYDF